MTDYMNIQQLGKLLQQERIRKGLTVEDIFNETKISPLHIVAIEEGDFQKMPHPAFARGFTRNYSRLLGLNSPEIQDAIKAAFSEKPQISPAKHSLLQPVMPSKASGKADLAPVKADSMSVAGPPEDSSLPLSQPQPAIPKQIRKVFNIKRGILGLIILAGVVFLSVIGLRTAGLFQSDPTGEPAQQAVPAPESESESESEPPEIAKKSLPAAAAPESISPPPPIPDLPQPAEPPAEIEEILKNDTDSEPVEATEATESAETPAPLLPVRQQLEIRAQSVCWMRVWPDEQPSRDYLLQPGNQLVIEFDKTVQIRFGNAGGVTLFLNGEAYPLNAASGEVRTIRIP